MESQQVWRATAEAIYAKHWKEADKAKNLVEERQRVYLREVDKGTIKHQMTFFEPTADPRKFTFRHPPSRKTAADASGEEAKGAHEYGPEELSGWLGALKL